MSKTGSFMSASTSTLMFMVVAMSSRVSLAMLVGVLTVHHVCARHASFPLTPVAFTLAITPIESLGSHTVGKAEMPKGHSVSGTCKTAPMSAFTMSHSTAPVFRSTVAPMVGSPLGEVV